MKKRKIKEINFKSSVTIQGVKKQTKMHTFLSLKTLRRCGYDTVLQVNSNKGVALLSRTASKN